MAHTIVTLTGRFTLVFKIKKGDLKKIQELMNTNGFIHAIWQPMVFAGFYEVRIDCNLRQAELIRQLLKNYSLYE